MNSTIMLPRYTNKTYSKCPHVTTHEYMFVHTWTEVAGNPVLQIRDLKSLETYKLSKIGKDLFILTRIRH